MTKWFDTNYHYVVPEVDRRPRGCRPCRGASRWRRDHLGGSRAVQPGRAGEGRRGGPGAIARPLAVPSGSWRAKSATDSGCSSTSRGWEWRAPTTMRPSSKPPTVSARRSGSPWSPCSSARPPTRLPWPSSAGCAVRCQLDRRASLGTRRERRAGARGICHGRPERLGRPLRTRSQALARLAGEDTPLRAGPSTSLMFLPYTTEGEDLPDGFQFAREKAAALATWADALEGGAEPPTVTRPSVAIPPVGEVETRAPPRGTACRPGRPRSASVSHHHHRLPPQTAEVRRLRVSLRSGDIDRRQYDDEIDRMITDAVALAGEAGLDVLVHGEFERTDMVEYFGERMDGYLTTDNGWVNSVRLAIVRPPILTAPPSISEPMTVANGGGSGGHQQAGEGDAHRAGDHRQLELPPPGVPDDRLFWAVAQPIAQEVDYLEQAGARIVQIDEPAVRERWPLPRRTPSIPRGVRQRGEGGAGEGVRRAIPGPNPYPHVLRRLRRHRPALVRRRCGCGLGGVLPVEGRELHPLFYDLFDDGHLAIGPGVFDVHSPHSPVRR